MGGKKGEDNVRAGKRRRWLINEERVRAKVSSAYAQSEDHSSSKQRTYYIP